jgi:hypothetical protein
MQSKFSSNLKQLAALLQSWEAQEKSTFDASLLSEDVRMLLKDPNQMESWVEERTKFMGLRTVKSQTPKKRPRTALVAGVVGSTKSSSRCTSSLTPPRKKQATTRPDVTRPPVAKKFDRATSDGKKKSREKGVFTLQDANAQPSQVRSPKRSRTRNVSSFRPFDNILSSMTSPPHDSEE